MGRNRGRISCVGKVERLTVASVQGRSPSCCTVSGAKGTIGVGFTLRIDKGGLPRFTYPEKT